MKLFALISIIFVISGCKHTKTFHDTSVGPMTDHHFRCAGGMLFSTNGIKVLDTDGDTVTCNGTFEVELSDETI